MTPSPLKPNDRNGSPSGLASSHRAKSDGKPTANISFRPPQAINQTLAAEFDQPVILQQSPVWSRVLLWGILGVTTFTIAWAAIAQVEEAIPATGKLEPQGTVQEVRSPLDGVVQTVLIKEGQSVKKGDVILRLDPTTARSQQQALEKIRISLRQENSFYRQQLQDKTVTLVSGMPLSPEMLALTRSRTTLLAENQLYRTQLSGQGAEALTADQRIRLQILQAETSSRVQAAALEVEQLQRQLAESETKLAGVEKLLAVNEKILADIQPVAEAGALSRIQYLQQVQQVESQRTERERLTQEKARLTLAIAQSQQKRENSIALASQDWLNRIAENDKKVAEIDSQINRIIIDNEKRIAETESQLSQIKVTLQYQELRSPADGTVFDLKASQSGYVTSTRDPLLKIVPDQSLNAEVFITNKDIGFVKPGMEVDVRVDSYPFSEFGDVKGKITTIGSDALPPDQIHPFYRFPARIKLDQQQLVVDGKSLPLRSGMSVSINIKVRKRTVLSLFADEVLRKLDALREM
ncbi:MAG: HlyD family efflux transporter periplasmic adaptor subunit [Synechococcales bacterium]|nr:HlyD family efflux transporter periplasmic adaptor subunit [Synechococcales bacterium]